MAAGKLYLSLLGVLLAVQQCGGVRYEPNWASLDARPLPGWYDEGKIGIFIHWGVFSVPSYNNEWFWFQWKNQKLPNVVKYMEDNYKPGFTYADFAADFTAELFDPNQWADIFKASGARYVVLTSKHHEGFTNWPSNHSFNWNAKAVGPNKDLVGLLANAIRSRTSIHFGLYHSLFEWFNPVYNLDAQNNFTTNDFVKYKSMPELYEIVNAYKPDVIWSDGDAGPVEYWNSTGFLAWLYNDSPVKDTVVTNDRWGTGAACHHGGYYTCQDRYNPGHLVSHKWENCLTLDKKSWGFRREAPLEDYLTTAELLATIAETVSCGGNVLINVGPTRDGTLMPLFEERLRSMGKWLDVNGEAIYETVPWPVAQNDSLTPGVWYTSKKTSQGGRDVYAIVLNWPDIGSFPLGSPSPNTNTAVTLLGYPEPISWTASGDKGIKLMIPAIPFNKMPCSDAWVFKMTNLK